MISTPVRMYCVTLRWCAARNKGRVISKVLNEKTALQLYAERAVVGTRSRISVPLSCQPGFTVLPRCRSALLAYTPLFDRGWTPTWQTLRSISDEPQSSLLGHFLAYGILGISVEVREDSVEVACFT